MSKKKVLRKIERKSGPTLIIRNIKMRFQRVITRKESCKMRQLFRAYWRKESERVEKKWPT